MVPLDLTQWRTIKKCYHDALERPESLRTLQHVVPRGAGPPRRAPGFRTRP
ncbi:MAG: hypothetical protein GY724_10400 [Actinomycetia bacterium]|nr:hypothetical protein [Actinomycetes bacterium]MCP4222829.1 hypothetical protein [Actinomycetes bacterium]MCP5035336.1 hypothetical protein [Actinomycetes bacterium]